MSMNPNDPFESPPTYQPAPQQGSNTWLWIIGIIGVLGVVGVLVCCGGFYALFSFGSGWLANAFQEQLQGNPVIVENIGEIESMEMNFSKTGQEAQNSDGDLIAFDIHGTKSSGTILIEQDKSSGDGTRIGSAILILEDGSRVKVPLEDWVDEEFDIDLGDIDLGEVDVPIETSEAEPQPQ